MSLFIKRATKLKETTIKTCNDKVMLLNKTINDLNIKEKVASEEMSKIAAMDDEAFGNSNMNQKIRHVQSLKNQNTQLKQVILFKKIL